jgi:branched-chain amino acid transport system ATP-binding protein
MRFVGLEKYIEARADAMPYGALKRLEIARALAMKPRLIFLDEPAAGLNPKETIEVDELVRKVADSGHHGGARRARHEDGDEPLRPHPGARLRQEAGRRHGEEVRRNPDVIAAYLGAHA